MLDVKSHVVIGQGWPNYGP